MKTSAASRKKAKALFEALGECIDAHSRFKEFLTEITHSARKLRSSKEMSLCPIEDASIAAETRQMDARTRLKDCYALAEKYERDEDKEIKKLVSHYLRFLRVVEEDLDELGRSHALLRQLILKANSKESLWGTVGQIGDGTLQAKRKDLDRKMRGAVKKLDTEFGQFADR